MKPFDLEAAKRGEPIVTNSNNPRLFVGIDSAGYVVVEDLMGKLIRYPAGSLCMAPKKRTVWVNLYHVFYTEEEADAADTFSNDHRIGGKAYPVEIEE